MMGFIATLPILACSFNKGYQMFTLSCLHLVGKFYIFFFVLFYVRETIETTMYSWANKET